MFSQNATVLTCTVHAYMNCCCYNQQIQLLRPCLVHAVRHLVSFICKTKRTTVQWGYKCGTSRWRTGRKTETVHWQTLVGRCPCSKRKEFSKTTFSVDAAFESIPRNFQQPRPPLLTLQHQSYCRMNSSPWRFPLIDITLPTQTTSNWLRRWFVLAVEFQLRLLVASVVKISTWAMALPCQKVAFARDSFWPKLLLFSNVTRLAVKFSADNLKSSRIRRC